MTHHNQRERIWFLSEGRWLMRQLTIRLTATDAGPAREIAVGSVDLVGTTPWLATEHGAPAAVTATASRASLP